MSRGKTKVNETSPINFYPPKNRDPFYYKTINGERYYYRYTTYGKEEVVREIKHLKKRGYKIRVEWVEDERYIIWRHNP